MHAAFICTAQYIQYNLKLGSQSDKDLQSEMVTLQKQIPPTIEPPHNDHFVLDNVIIW